VSQRLKRVDLRSAVSLDHLVASASSIGETSTPSTFAVFTKLALLLPNLPAFGLQHRNEFRCQRPICFGVADEDICHGRAHGEEEQLQQ
jgi:hypothetical protein